MIRVSAVLFDRTKTIANNVASFEEEDGQDTHINMFCTSFPCSFFFYLSSFCVSRYTTGRVAMNLPDFALSDYSYANVSNDVLLQHFDHNLTRDNDALTVATDTRKRTAAVQGATAKHTVGDTVAGAGAKDAPALKLFSAPGTHMSIPPHAIQTLRWNSFRVPSAERATFNTGHDRDVPRKKPNSEANSISIVVSMIYFIVQIQCGCTNAMRLPRKKLSAFLIKLVLDS